MTADDKVDCIAHHGDQSVWFQVSRCNTNVSAAPDLKRRKVTGAAASGGASLEDITGPPPPPHAPPFSAQRMRQLNSLKRQQFFSEQVRRALALASTSIPLLEVSVLDVSDFSLCAVMAASLGGKGHRRSPLKKQ